MFKFPKLTLYFYNEDLEVTDRTYLVHFNDNIMTIIKKIYFLMSDFLSENDNPFTLDIEVKDINFEAIYRKLNLSDEFDIDFNTMKPLLKQYISFFYDSKINSEIMVSIRLSLNDIDENTICHSVPIEITRLI